MAKRGKRGNSVSPPQADTDVARTMNDLRRDVANLTTLVQTLVANSQAQPPAAPPVAVAAPPAAPSVAAAAPPAPPVAAAAPAPVDPPAPPPAAPGVPAPVVAAAATPAVAALSTVPKPACSSRASRREQTVWVSNAGDPEAVAVGSMYFRGPLVEELDLKNREQKWLLNSDVERLYPELYKVFTDMLQKDRARYGPGAAAHKDELLELDTIGAIIEACGRFGASNLANLWVLSRTICRKALLSYHQDSWENYEVSVRLLYGDNSEVERNEAIALLAKEGGAAKKKASGGRSGSDDVSVVAEASKQFVALDQTDFPAETPYAPRQQQPWSQCHTFPQAPAAAPQPYASSVSWGQQRRGPVDPANVICFRCNTKGHFVNECPQPQVGDAYAPHAPRDWVPRYQTPNAAQPSSSLVSSAAGSPPRSEWLGVFIVGYSK